MSEITIEKYLKKDEKILWRGKAKEGEVLLCAIFNVFPVMLLWLAAEMLILAYAGYNAIFGKFNVYYLILSIAAVLLHFVPIGVWLSGAVKENERIKGDEYYITDKRVIIIHSYAHDSVEFIDRSEIDDAFLKRSFAEVILGSGKIVIETSDEKIVFRSIEDAQNNFKKAYKALFKKQGEARANETSISEKNASELGVTGEKAKEEGSSAENESNDEN